MQIEDQVCSLEYAKKLKELGVKQKSSFRYYNEYFNEPNILFDFYQNNEIGISAFSVAELLEILPKVISNEYLQIHTCARDGWWVFYWDGDVATDISGGSTWDHSLPDSLCKQIINLIENKLIEVPK